MKRSALGLALVGGLCAGPALAQDMIWFQSPTQNIQCLLETGEFAGVRCDLGALIPSYTQVPADCPFDYGSSFSVGPQDRRGVVNCISDTVANPEGLVLGYGKSVTLGGITCRSEKTGMTCTNPAGHGFTIAKAKQRVF